jgi:hypothetical protein
MPQMIAKSLALLLCSVGSLCFVGTGIMLMGYWTKSRIPNLTAADGIYYNICCKQVYIRNGFIKTANKTTKLRLSFMKFGLTGYPYEKIGLFESENTNTLDQQSSPLLFNSTTNPHSFETVDYNNNTYIFVKLNYLNE